MTEIAADAPVTPSPRRPSGKPRSSSGSVVLAALFALLVVGAAVAGMKPLRFGAAVRDLTAEDPAARAGAEAVLKDLREYASGRVPALAASASPAQRLRAVRAVRVLELSDAVPTLASLCADADPAVRRESVLGLGELATAGSEPAMKALLDLSERTDADPALGEALARLSPSAESGRRLLGEQALKALGTPGHPSAAVRLGFTEAAGALLSGAETAPAEALPLFRCFVLRLADPDAAVRNAASGVLLQVRGEPRRELALAALADADAWVRLWAESELRALQGTGVGHDPLAPVDRAAAQESWRKAPR